MNPDTENELMESEFDEELQKKKYKEIRRYKHTNEWRNKYG